MHVGMFEYTSLKQVLFDQTMEQALTALLQNDALVRGSPARIFVLMSATLNSRADLRRRLEVALGSQLAGSCDAVAAHTPRKDVLAALQMARDVNAEVIVTIGGGSVIDAGKVIQFCLNADIRDEEALLRYARFSDGSSGDLSGTRPETGLKRPVYQIAVPTTLSAAEFSNNAGVTDTANSTKEGYRFDGLCARYVIYDPFLVQYTPDWLWLSTAVRSLDHAIEGYCSVDVFPYLQGHFLHAVRLLRESLPAMYKSPADAGIRSLNQQAVWLAGCGLGRVRHGASHGIGYVLGAQCGVPHGHTSCVMLPAVLRWNFVTNGTIQRAIGAGINADGQLLDEWIVDWLKEMELPVRLRDIGVTREQLPGVALAAAGNSVVRSNPRPIRSADDVMEILELAW